MYNFNFSKISFTSFRPWKLSKDKPDNCSGNCPAKIKSLLWIKHHLFWTYQCLCCHTYQFVRGKSSPEWGGVYE